ncbi:MAG: hypothetical protein Q7T33_07595 [Dehalococcoidia bacterium]|nr:hypothetical protein [Dehalococcoidia bacterium]
MRRAALLAPGLLALAFLAAPAAPRAGAEADLLHITSRVSYDVKTGDQPVRVSWDVTVRNDDASTKNTGQGAVSFYDKLSLPLLRDARSISALSAEGAALRVTLDESPRGPAIPASVELDRRLFYQDTYSFSLTYDLPEVRQDSLLVTPAYVYLPAVAAGDEATVTVNTPADPAWSVNLEAGGCAQSGNSFTCSGSDSTYLAALVEVSRPDAIGSLPFSVQLKQASVSLTVAFFQGEDAAALHLQELATAALPAMEDVYGVAYDGPAAVTVAQGGRQVALGYEGLTECDAAACKITVSPIADDSTVLHELAHLWSGLYTKRWLSEGFAQLVAAETGARLPPGLVRGEPPVRQPSTVELQLDDWGEVTSAIGTSEAELAVQNAGYDRSQRFLEQLRDEVGLEALQRVNETIAASAQPADSRRFMDLLEEAAGGNLDGLFRLWVFPNSYGPALESRREARDRLQTLEDSVKDTGLSGDVLQSIREDVEAWRFGVALPALDRAEAGLATFDELVARLAKLRSDAEAAALTLPGDIDRALARWDFAGAGDMLARAEEAAQAYAAARRRVDEPRNIWERFGLLGSDPDGDLRAAAASFARGDYDTAIRQADAAAHAVGDAPDAALRRLLIVAGIFAVLAAAIGVAVWLLHRREREFAEQ